MNRRSLLAAVALLLPASLARAATQGPFDQAAFAAAQAAGKPILVAVHASWCPTCAKQRPIIADLAAAPANKDLMIFVVDFDAPDSFRAFARFDRDRVAAAGADAGVLLGASLPADWKLEFAAPLAFIAMSVPFIRDRALLAAAG